MQKKKQKNQRALLMCQSIGQSPSPELQERATAQNTAASTDAVPLFDVHDVTNTAAAKFDGLRVAVEDGDGFSEWPVLSKFSTVVSDASAGLNRLFHMQHLDVPEFAEIDSGDLVSNLERLVTLLKSTRDTTVLEAAVAYLYISQLAQEAQVFADFMTISSSIRNRGCRS